MTTPIYIYKRVPAVYIREEGMPGGKTTLSTRSGEGKKKTAIRGDDIKSYATAEIIEGVRNTVADQMMRGSSGRGEFTVDARIARIYGYMDSLRRFFNEIGFGSVRVRVCT